MAIEVELPGHRFGRQIGDVPEHPCKGEAGIGELVRAVVLAVVEVWVGLDRVAADHVERDRLRRNPCRTGDDDCCLNVVGVTRRPAQGLMGAERATDDRAEALDAEQVDETLLRVDHVLDGHQREVAAIRNLCGRVDDARPGRPAAPAEHVRADDEQTIGVDGLARTHEPVPPTRLIVFVVPREVRVTRDRMADEHRVAAVLVECPVRFVRDLDAWKHAAVAKLHRHREDRRLNVAERLCAPHRIRAFEVHDHESRLAYPTAAASAWSMSAMMSFTSSMPTEMRTYSGTTPVCCCSAGLNCWCVVDAG